MKWTLVVFSICFLYPLNIEGQNEEWILEVGLKAAIALPTVFTDGNYSNIVILERVGQPTTDLVIDLMTDIIFNTLMTLRYISVGQDDDSVDRILDQFEAQDSTLFIVTDWTILPAIFRASADNSSHFARNFWFVIMPRESSETSRDLLESRFNEYASIRLDSKLYFLVVTGTSADDYQSDLNEVYKIIPQELAINVLALFENNSWQSKNEDFIWERRRNLQGLELQLLSVTSPPFTYHHKNENKWTGMYFDLLDALKTDLNFTYVIREPEDGTFGSLTNGSWSGIIKDLQNRRGDIAVVDLSVTEQRSQVVDFTVGLEISASKLYMKIPQRSLSWSTFTRVFDTHFMLLLAASTVTLSLIFFIIFYFVNNETTIGPGLSVATVWLGLLALEIPVAPNRMPGRILVFTVSIYGALVFWAYNAGLVSLLTAETFVYPIKSMKDLAEKSNYKLLLQGGTAYVDYFRSASEFSDRGIVWKRMDFQDQVLKSTKDIEARLLKDSNYVFFGPEVNVVVDFDSVPCNVSSDANAERYFEVSISWALQKDSQFTDFINFFLTNLKESGQINRLMARDVSSIESVQCPTELTKPIQIENIFTAFLIVGIGMFFAVLISIVEKLRGKPNKVKTEDPVKTISQDLNDIRTKMKKMIKDPRLSVKSCDLILEDKYQHSEFKLTLFQDSKRSMRASRASGAWY